MANENELHYIIKFTAEGKPEIVELAGEIRKSGEAIEETEAKLQRVFTKTGPNVNEQAERSRKIFEARRKSARKMADDIAYVSQAERNMEAILAEADAALERNTYALEAARLEYETGAVSQEEYVAELQRLKAEIEKVDAPSSRLIRRQRQINAELVRMQPAMQGTATGTRSANSALFSMATGLATLNPAMGGTATTLISMSRSMGSLSATSGSALGGLRSLAAFATSPGGIIAVFSIVATGIGFAISKLDLFNDKTEEAEEAQKRLASAVKSGLGAVLNDFSDEGQIRAIEHAVEQLLRADEVAEAVEGADLAYESLMKSIDGATLRASQLHAVQSDRAPAESVRAAEAALAEAAARQSEVNDLVLEELNRRLAVARANQLVAASLRELGLEQQKLNEADFNFDLSAPDIDQPFFDEAADRQAEAFAERIKTRLRNLDEAASTTFQDIADAERVMLQSLADDTVLSEREKERLRTQIRNEFSERRNRIEERETQKAILLQEQLTQAKIHAASLVAGALQGFGAVIAGESEKNARKRFEIDKALNYAAAVVNTAAGVTKALSASPPPVNFIQASAVGAAGAIQIAKIAATKFGGRSGAAAGPAGSVGYRGFGSSDATIANPISDAGRPRSVAGADRSAPQTQTREIRILDGFGNLVARGQEEIDRNGGSDYMRGGL